MTHDQTAAAARNLDPAADHARATMLSALAKARADELTLLWEQFPDKPRWEHLKAPETGMVMVRGRTGGDGAPFNLGEMTVSRCVVRLDDGRVGVGYCGGRNRAQAETIAVIDALAHDPAMRQALHELIVAPLTAHAEQRDRARSLKAAASRVDFLTMVRGE